MQIDAVIVLIYICLMGAAGRSVLQRGYKPEAYKQSR